MEKKASLNVLIACLKLLDSKLSKTGTSIEVKAVGGFALLYHGIRKDGYTVDIDTVSHDYPTEVTMLIHEVGTAMGTEAEWLNNTIVDNNDVAAVEVMLEPFWEKADLGLSHITLYVADIETLLRTKLIVADETEITGRTQDMPDVFDIFVKMGAYDSKSRAALCEKLDIDLSAYPTVHSHLLEMDTANL